MEERMLQYQNEEKPKQGSHIDLRVGAKSIISSGDKHNDYEEDIIKLIKQQNKLLSDIKTIMLVFLLLTIIGIFWAIELQ